MSSHSRLNNRTSHQILTCCGTSHASMPIPAKLELAHNPTSNGHWCVTLDHADLKFLVCTLYSDFNKWPTFRVLIFISLWIIVTIKTGPSLLLLNATRVVSMQKLWLGSRRHAPITVVTAAERPRCDIPKYVRIVRNYVSVIIFAGFLRGMRFRGIINLWKKKVPLVLHKTVRTGGDGPFNTEKINS